MLDFNTVAVTKMEDVKAVPMPPVGTYRWRVAKLPTIREFSANGVDYQSVEFPVQVVAPMEDVDASDYPGSLTDIRQNLSFMYDRNDEVAFAQMQNQLKRFLVDHVKCCDASASLKEGMNASVNQQFLAPLNVAPDKKDPEILRARIGRTAPLD